MPKKIRVGIYVRVSTDDQSVENQRVQLQEVAERHGWEVVEVYADQGVSGAKARDERPAMKRLLKAVARREVDMIAAWSVDRLGRGLLDLIGFLGELHAKGVDLYLHQQGFDTSTPTGRAMYQLMGVFAEFERAMIVERVRAGVRRAQKAGTKSGKAIGRPRLPDDVEQRVRASLAAGAGIHKTAKLLGIGTSAVQRIRAA